MAKKKRRKKATDATKLPRSPDYRAAQQSLVQSNILQLLGEQTRTQSVLRGAFGGVTLRRTGGSSLYGYGIKKPTGDPGWRKYYRS